MRAGDIPQHHRRRLAMWGLPPTQAPALAHAHRFYADPLSNPFFSLSSHRYRAMFALRNRGGVDAIAALTSSFASSNSALLKHEVAYVLGQMQDAQAVEQLR